MQIDGTSALVTGGASGLGAATARMLAEAGAKVTILDINEGGAIDLAKEIGGHGLAVDVTSSELVRAAFNVACNAYGVPRIVVSCAGIGGASRIVGRDGVMPLADFERVIRVNLIGTFNVMRIAAHQISLADGPRGCRGAIVNTASVAAFEGQIGQAAYAASKGGIVSMALPAAREFARFAIRVNTIAPGVFDTSLLQELGDDARDALERTIMHPSRLGDPAEFAHTVKYVVENDYLNGEVIRLDAATRLAPK
ncbi:SDR family NAD(P)-dependent oxidoreductase [Pseudoroseicyclus tamaricis]|uniref:SDR family NAD(P)-dependent oxidoreductase n=1 Tax=Pseudoroseicyclus tamaricis TaxID=2705421 RepID=A0A6B2JQI5_9RHOB|nr:SDR family NAD(P)-dependent oxidoreductase [Pseudoroseicyclus tamaricis]NDV00947.1 SDR family NAD(P)-dependent oxidoreductase [Pseudoroseicyclus tamaricis]